MPSVPIYTYQCHKVATQTNTSGHIILNIYTCILDVLQMLKLICKHTCHMYTLTQTKQTNIDIEEHI